MINRIFDLAKINEVITNFSDSARKEYYKYLIEEFGVLFTFHSNRIEGTNNTLTLNNTRKLLKSKRSINIMQTFKVDRDIIETFNHQNAFEFIFKLVDGDIKIDIIDLIGIIHSIIGIGTINNSGDYKNIENYLLNSTGKEINFTYPKDVENRMLELRKKYYEDWKNLTVFERAVRLHMAIINIHPFSDGNGRCARLLMNYELIKNNYPPVLINEKYKLSYYSMIEEINNETDYLNKPFDIGDIDVFVNTIQQLSIMTFKNMQKYYEK